MSEEELNLSEMLFNRDEKLIDMINSLRKENESLKYHLNDMVFDDDNNDVELGARLLRKLGYCDFDDERKVYLNKHNNEPLMQEQEREKAFFIKDDELDDYTKQLESKIDKVFEYVINDGYDINTILHILRGNNE